MIIALSIAVVVLFVWVIVLTNGNTLIVRALHAQNDVNTTQLAHDRLLNMRLNQLSGVKEDIKYDA